MTKPPRPPAHLLAYVEILGVDLAVEFLLAFGGAELYLARNPSASGKLAGVIGQDKATELAAAADRMRLPKRVPTGKEWIARVLSWKGLPVAEIARILHMSDNAVRGYLKPDRQPRRAPDYRQLPLI
jgi:hypothetical protein